MRIFTFQPWTGLVKIYVLFDHINGVLRAVHLVRETLSN